MPISRRYPTKTTGAGINTGTNDTNFATSKAIADSYLKLTSILGAVYPIGCIYTETTGTNPGTTFGFGTWSAYGAGRVMVSKAAAGTFSTAGATGGAESHTLTSGESGLPSHLHAEKLPNAGTGNGGVYGPNPLTQMANGLGGIGVNTDTTTALNAGSAHNNLQPYIVVYVWTRTA